MAQSNQITTKLRTLTQRENNNDANFSIGKDGGHINITTSNDIVALEGIAPGDKVIITIKKA